MIKNKLKGLLILSLMVTALTFGQEYNHQEIKSKLYSAVEASLPIRFNSEEFFRELFWYKCPGFPKICEKLTFDKITDFRISDVTKINFTNNNGDIDPLKYYKIVASLDFTFNFPKSNKRSTTVILECAVKNIVDGYEIDYIKVLGTKKSLYGSYKPVDYPYFILTHLDFKKE